MKSEPRIAFENLLITIIFFSFFRGEGGGRGIVREGVWSISFSKKKYCEKAIIM